METRESWKDYSTFSFLSPPLVSAPKHTTLRSENPLLYPKMWIQFKDLHYFILLLLTFLRERKAETNICPMCIFSRQRAVIWAAPGAKGLSGAGQKTRVSRRQLQTPFCFGTKTSSGTVSTWSNPSVSQPSALVRHSRAGRRGDKRQSGSWISSSTTSNTNGWHKTDGARNSDSVQILFF